MQGNFGADRENYLKSLMRPDLLVLDDLGAERNTAYGKERVFDVINNRRLSCKPMIITTNIPVNAMQKATDLDDRRIYDRILEVCTPIAFNGDSFRKKQRRRDFEKVGAVFERFYHLTQHKEDTLWKIPTTLYPFIEKSR